MWGLDSTASAVLLGQPTTLFDNCGAYDFKAGGNPIDKSSTFSDWSNALKYLEWYGIPHMDGFGIIFIDDQNQNKYIQFTNSELGEPCFERATAMVTSFIISLSTLAAILSW